jgi:hypothetical protein
VEVPSGELLQLFGKLHAVFLIIFLKLLFETHQIVHLVQRSVIDLGEDVKTANRRKNSLFTRVPTKLALSFYIPRRVAKEKSHPSHSQTPHLDWIGLFSTSTLKA